MWATHGGGGGKFHPLRHKARYGMASQAGAAHISAQGALAAPHTTSHHFLAFSSRSAPPQQHSQPPQVWPGAGHQLHRSMRPSQLSATMRLACIARWALPHEQSLTGAAASLRSFAAAAGSSEASTSGRHHAPLDTSRAVVALEGKDAVPFLQVRWARSRTIVCLCRMSLTPCLSRCHRAWCRTTCGRWQAQVRNPLQRVERRRAWLRPVLVRPPHSFAVHRLAL